MIRKAFFVAIAITVLVLGLNIVDDLTRFGNMVVVASPVEQVQQDTTPRPAENIKQTDQDKSQKQTQEDKPTKRTEYSRESVWLVVGVLGLLATLFFLMILWSNRLEQTSYLGMLYRETVEEMEYKRLATPSKDRWVNGEYHKEASEDIEWLDKNPRPPRPPRFIGTGSGNRRPGSKNPFAEPPVPPPVPPNGDPELPEVPPERDSPLTEEEKQEQANLEKAWQAYNQVHDQWREKVESEASRRYKDELKKVRDKAKEQADRAANT